MTHICCHIYVSYMNMCRGVLLQLRLQWQWDRYLVSQNILLVLYVLARKRRIIYLAVLLDVGKLKLLFFVGLYVTPTALHS